MDSMQFGESFEINPLFLHIIIPPIGMSIYMPPFKPIPLPVVNFLGGSLSSKTALLYFVLLACFLMEH